MPYKDKDKERERNRVKAWKRRHPEALIAKKSKELTIYQPKQLRSQLINGERYWCVADICEDLGIINHHHAIKTLQKGVVLKYTLLLLKENTDGGTQSMLFIDYAGALEISLQSRKPRAKLLRGYVVQQMKDKTDASSQLNRIEDRLERIEDRLETKAQIIAIDMSPRSKINKLVRDYAKNKEIPHDHVFGTLYTEFEYRYHVNLVVTARNRGISPIQRCEDLNLINEMANLAIHLFVIQRMKIGKIGK